MKLANTMQEDAYILETKNLSKTFGGLIAVNQVTLQFHPKKLHSVIGPNSAGKTTLFNLVTGMFPPSSGEVIFKGSNITHLTPQAILRRGIVHTFQISNVFPELSVFQNVIS